MLGNGSRISAADTVPLCLWVIAHRAQVIVGGVLALRTGLGGIPPAWRDAREALPAGPWQDLA